MVGTGFLHSGEKGGAGGTGRGGLFIGTATYRVKVGTIKPLDHIELDPRRY